MPKHKLHKGPMSKHMMKDGTMMAGKKHMPGKKAPKKKTY